MANSGTDRNRFAVVKSGMMGGGLSVDDAADAVCVVDVVIANGVVRRAVCKMLLRLSDENNNAEEEVAVVSSS